LLFSGYINFAPQEVAIFCIFPFIFGGFAYFWGGAFKPTFKCATLKDNIWAKQCQIKNNFFFLMVHLKVGLNAPPKK
jgi:hypothetical protein